MTGQPLTGPTLRVLLVIQNLTAERGYPPSMREIAARAGLSSLGTVTYHLRQLEAKGYIRRDPRRPRTLTVLDPPGEVTT